MKNVRFGTEIFQTAFPCTHELGTTPILNLPYSVNVISRQLIDDTQSRNFKEAAKYLPLVMFQEMQGPEVLRPEARGMQGSNMQNDLKDGMGIAVTTPSALEEYEQIEVMNGLGGPLFGPATSVADAQTITRSDRVAVRAKGGKQKIALKLSSRGRKALAGTSADVIDVGSAARPPSVASRRSGHWTTGRRAPS